MNKAVIVGATSGIGSEVAKLLLDDGWTIGVAGRREDRLEELRRLAPDRVFVQVIDICRDDAPDRLQELISAMGGIDLYFHASGVGKQNPNLDTEIELDTLYTNGLGFVRMINMIYKYFEQIPDKAGHIAIISSIAGTKGIGVAPAYSATKRMQSIYLESLAQLAHIKHLNIKFTDILPGFVDTDLLNDSKRYPMLMKPQNVARHIVRAIKKKKRTAIIDWRYRLVVAVWRIFPLYWWERLKIRN